MTEYKAGQRVKIELEGDIAGPGDGMHAYLKANGFLEYPHGDRLYLLNLAGVKVTLADPEDWPPQLGDIWEANGFEYFAYSCAPGELIIKAFHNGEVYWSRVGLLGFKALNPALVRRRGQ